MQKASIPESTREGQLLWLQARPNCVQKHPKLSLRHAVWVTHGVAAEDSVCLQTRHPTRSLLKQSRKRIKAVILPEVGFGPFRADIQTVQRYPVSLSGSPPNPHSTS
jgi:hypothetical protein